MKKISILNPISNHYRKFKENQTLTDKQLNEFIDYFNDQDHLSRIGLNGVGIVAGFDVSFLNKANNDIKIQINQGYAVTTDGDLLFFQKDIKKHEKEVVSPFIINEFKNFTHFINYDNKGIYEPFHINFNNNNKKQLNIWELKTSKGSENAKLLHHFNEDFEKMVVILYLENFEKESDACKINNCDNQGLEQIANLRVLLISEDDIARVLENDDIYSKHNWKKFRSQLPELKLKRVVLNNTNTMSYEMLSNEYSEIIKYNDSIKELVTGYDLLFSKFGKKSISNDIKKLFNFTTFPEDFQYRYDVLRDLIDTYDEIKELLLHINVECCPNINSFQKHILLGKVVEQEKYNTFRHSFYKTPFTTHEDNNYKKILSLIDRAKYISTKYKPDTGHATIKITPSTLYSSLDNKAIPYYYILDNELLLAWSYDKTLNFKEKYNFSYHTENLLGFSKSPLLYNLNSDFYRIEGHLGLNAFESKSFIDTLKRDNGLDFDCVLFDLNKQKREFAQFLKENPSLTHEAGVTKGGTFVLLSYNEKIKADFYLNYKINTINDDHGCCDVKECSYPWISTLKYLNNLSRSLRGKQSNNHAMPKDYVLHILDYKINGEPIITTQATIRIPLTTIFSRRMHAITEALNNRFNNGVVFDFDDHQKRLIIISGKNDTYKIRFTEETIKQNNDVYTYSNTGMKKNNMPIKYNAMICKDKITHSTSLYNKLHKKFAPINKDDDNHGYFYGKWKKWNILKDNLRKHVFFKSKIRIINRVNDLPKIQRDLITNIKSDISSLNVEKPLMLDGDWVNENWVDEEMLTYYNEGKHTTNDDIEKDNIINTHDDLILFINLRKNLHNESGITKLSLYIEKPYDATFDDLIEKYSSTVDFFFEKAKGLKAIVV